MATDDGLLLLKVPKWLSDVWLKSPPEAVVADLDVEAGTLKLLTDIGKDRPKTLGVTRRASPELFAFPAGEDSTEVPISGSIREALNVRADLKDSAYQSLLKRRLEDSSITSANRSRYMEKLQHPDNRPLAEAVSSAGSQAQEPADPNEGDRGDHKHRKLY